MAGACYPECHLESKDRVSDVRSLKTKVNAGASFLITQLFLDNSFFYSFEENARIAGIKVPISAGILPVINKAQIEKMVSICGASLPDKFAKIINKFENNKEALFDAGMSFVLSFGSYTIITTRGVALNVGQFSALLTYSWQILFSLMMFSLVFVMAVL